ncbi:MAG TPA: amidase family protein, partial [Gemmatimonadaceae bacterium]|nr:amidase family protein [Gemmatimonadaceae bacterium]
MSVHDAVEAAFARADAVQAWRDGLNILVSGDRHTARAAAEQTSGGPLAGTPVVVKDNIATTDLPTTCGSRILEGYVSPYEATAITRLRGA